MIRLQHVTKRYGPVRAVDDVTLEVNGGTIYGLIGPNGAGKTTLLRLMAGLVSPTSGSVTLPSDGRRPGARPRVGYLPQRVAFNTLATPREVVRLFARLRGLPAASVTGSLEDAGLGEAADRQIRTLSGGMRQRLGLAIACLGDPGVLLLDEPDAGLDPRAAIELRQRVRMQAARGRTIVFSSHSLPELETICDRLAILLNGRLVREGSVHALKALAAEGSLERVFLEATS